MDKPYQTRDIYLAAFLLLNQQKLTNTLPKGKVVYFTFEHTPSLEKLTLDYFAGATRVEPLRYIESIKRLRHLVRDRLNQY